MKAFLSLFPRAVRSCAARARDGVAALSSGGPTPAGDTAASARLLCAAAGEGRSYTSRGGRGGGGGEQQPRSRRVDTGEPRRVPPQAAGALSPQLLNSLLTNAETGEELLGLCDSHVAQFNYIHVSTALSALAKKHPVVRWKEDDRTMRLVALAGDKLDAMGGRALANSLWAIAKLGLPQPGWTGAWLRAALGKMGQMNPQGLSNMVYALSLFQFTPDSEWMDAFWQASLAVLQADSEAARFDPQQLSNSVYALAKLGLLPPSDWFTAFYSASSLQMRRMNPQNLANTLWACATLNTEPPAAWMDAFWSSSLPLLAGFNPQELANTLWACATLHTEPPAEWMAAFWSSSLQLLVGFNPQALTNTLWACATLHTEPPAAWMAVFWSSLLPLLDGFKPQNLANTLWACASLRMRPNDDWLACFLDASLAALPGFTSQNLSNTIWALAELNVVIGPEWMDAWFARAASSLDMFNEQEILSSLWALMLLQAYDSPLLEPLWGRAQQLLSPGSKAVDHRNFYCVYLAAAAEAPGLLAPPRDDLLAAARGAWQAQGASDALQRSSVNHAAVLQALGFLILDHKSEHLCAKSERHIDIALLGPRIAIEIDGPTHFLFQTSMDTHERTGTTLFRDRQLAAAGWRVVSLPWFELGPLVRPLKREARSPGELQTRVADYLSAKLRL